jgi:hypothetical protein
MPESVPFGKRVGLHSAVLPKCDVDRAGLVGLAGVKIAKITLELRKSG